MVASAQASSAMAIAAAAATTSAIVATVASIWHRMDGHTAKLFDNTVHSETCCWSFQIGQQQQQQQQ